MALTQNNLFRYNKAAFSTALVAIAVYIACAFITGVSYERKKLKAFIATVALVLVYQIFFADVFLMIVKAAFNAIHCRPPWTTCANSLFVGGPDRREYLQQRIIALKKQLELGPTFYKRNEMMTLQYKQVWKDLVLFGWYFLILFILIIGTRDPLMFYHTRTLMQILKNPVVSETSVDKVLTSEDLYKFINGTIIDLLNSGTSYSGEPFKDNGWIKFQIAKLLGVVRLRQIRLKNIKNRSMFDPNQYGPHWSKEFSSLPFKEKFWRIFSSWEYQRTIKTEDSDGAGHIYEYPGGGYVALLGRNVRNSRRVLKFLQDNQWIDSHTAVVVIEFTLYNVDADIFTLIKITAEQTPFNSFVLSTKVSAFKLFFNIDNLPWTIIVAMLLYFLTFIRILAHVILELWFSSSLKFFLSEYWNIVDSGIVVLNLSILAGLWRRESIVKTLLLRLESSRKNEFIPFSEAAFMDEICTVMIAFLIAISTIRLWKILQFAKVFRLLTRTLYKARGPLSSTTFFIFIFIVGIGLSSFIINGNNSPKFMSLINGITSLMSLTLGFTTDVSPSDLRYGGRVVGFILYAILVIAVSIFLINMFITVLCLQFSVEKEEERKRAEHGDSYTFWDFLVTEICEWFHGTSIWRKYSKGEGYFHTLRLRGGGGLMGKSKESAENITERLQLISDIVDTQVQLLAEIVGDTEEGEDEEHANLKDVRVIEDERPSSSKNAQRELRKMKRQFAEGRTTLSERRAERSV